MPKLTIHRGNVSRTLTFESAPVLGSLLGAELQRPCGGRGVCGKCAVSLRGAVSEPNEAELRAGTRLACQAVLLGDAEATLPEEVRLEQIEISGGGSISAADPMPGRLGAAVDIGTTTLALRLYELKSGALLGEAVLRNPQTSVAADVMGRIGAALNGALPALQAQVLQAVQTLLGEACAQAGRSAQEVDALVVAGNTTMLYLLTGRSPEFLSRAPFEADCLFGTVLRLLDRTCFLPPCMNAFVGADISCALLDSGLWRTDGIALLCDVGTNGEIALWKRGELFVTSTAAGPAFEGAGISCGCSSVRGAIDRAWVEDGTIRIHTIGEAEACGICGSGLIDAIVAALQLGWIDETGAMTEDSIPLAKEVALLPKDVRAVQLAKAAIAAGIETLLETAGVQSSDVEALYIAGGFGNHLNVNSAAAIGLIPDGLASRVHCIGNASLAGAAQLLLNQSAAEDARFIASRAKHVSLGGNPRFNEHYIDQMLFPEP
ncbi:MAG: ASKHA domain-containing protein [Candidatus Faecivicinus sp.]